MKTTRRRDEGVSIMQTTTCPECGGIGKRIDHPCKACAGTGRGERQELLTVEVPPGAEDGLVLRFAGKGYASEEPGGRPGDLLLVLRAAPDARFERDGADLLCRQEIDVVDAVLGAEISAPTLDGPVSMSVPAGTQPGSQLRLRGKGLPRYRARGRGDLYVTLAIRVPERLSAQERALWQKLRSLKAGG